MAPVGEEVGVGMLAIRTNDGLDDRCHTCNHHPGPGVYEPTAPAPPVGTRGPRVLPLALERALDSDQMDPCAQQRGIHKRLQRGEGPGTATAACGARSRSPSRVLDR